MIYADTSAGPHITATRGAVGVCPDCGEPVRAKCGSIVISHWAHLSRIDCDPWGEPESQWHLGWKQRFADAGASIEVTMRRDGQHHRADVVTNRGVIELQHSSIPIDMARDREEFYGRMLWLFDMTDHDRWDRVHFGRRGGFWWKNPAKSQIYLQRPVFWHVPDNRVLQINIGWSAQRLYPHERRNGVRVLGRVLREVPVDEFTRICTWHSETAKSGSAGAA